MNQGFGLSLNYQSLSIEDYTQQRKTALGEFLGTVIGGIYEGIRMGEANGESDYKEIAQRPHLSVAEMIEDFKKQN